MAIPRTDSVSRHYWHVAQPPALFDLIPTDYNHLHGWILLNGSLLRRGSDYTARLFYDLGDGFNETHSITPPISRKGTIHELIWLPRGIKALRWQAMNSPGDFEMSPLTMRKVCWIERIVRMLRRVLPVFSVHSRAKRLKVGLTAYRVLFDLRGSYEAAGKLRAYAPPVNYQAWLERFDTLSNEDRQLIRKHIERINRKPVISVVMPVYNPHEEFLRAAIESVRQQLYPHWELCIADDASTTPEARRVLEEFREQDPRIKVCYRTENGHIAEASNSALEQATGKFIALLDQDDVLAEQALYLFAVEISEHPDCVLLYSDEDKLTEGRMRFEPYHKPDWNYQLFLSQNYISHLGVYRTEVVRSLGGFRKGFEGSQDYDLALRMIEKARPRDIRHIPVVLYHWRATTTSTASDQRTKDYSKASSLRALNDHLARTRVNAKATPAAHTDFFRIRYELPKVNPLVTIIIPTRDQPALLRKCIESIFRNTHYPKWEIIVIDNRSTDENALHYLQQLSHKDPVTVLRYDHPFNYSAINNYAIRHARGEVLCLLNNDTQVITPEWIEEMLGVLLQPGVGIVGARLWYEDDTLQHGGVIIGAGGTANHAHAFLTRSDSGYFARAQLIQEFSAVTGACLMVRKSLYEQLGGLDEKNLAVAFNDIDFCLRAREAGWRVVWTPYAELYHHESKSRGKDDTPERKKRMKREGAYMHRRWGHVMGNDPYYNPNLSYERPDFILSHAPMIEQPWKE